MLSIALKSIKKCDIFGENIQLNIKGHNRTHTVLGGILTLMTCIMLAAAAWSMGNDLIYKGNPNTNMEDQLYFDRPFYELNKTSFPLSFCFQDYNQLTFNIPKYFAFEVLDVKTYNKNSTTVTSYYEWENCTFDHFPKFEPSYLTTAGVGKYLCLKNQNITIGGYWDNDFIQYSVFRIRLCSNKTDSVTCAPKEEIEDWINSRPIAFNVYFQNAIINTQNYTHPTQRYIHVLYKNIKLSSSKVMNVFIKGQEIVTDDGILFEVPRYDSSYSYDTSDVDDSDAIEESLMDINLFVSNHKPFYNRSYLKIQQLLADLGGLKDMLFVIAILLSTYFSQIKLNRTIFNKVFDFELEKRREKLRRSNSMNKMKSDFNLIRGNTAKDGKVEFREKAPEISKRRSKTIKKEPTPETADKMSPLDKDFTIELADQSIIQQNKAVLSKFPEFPEFREINIEILHPLHRESVDFLNDKLGNTEKKDQVVVLNSNELFLEPVSYTKRKPPSNTADKFKRSATKVPVKRKNYKDIIEKVRKKADQRNLKLSFCEMLMKPFCKRCVPDKTALKFSLYDKAEQELDILLDISYIVHKLEEFDKFKLIMLNNEQLAMFQFISRDICTLEEKVKTQSEISKLKQLSHDKEKLVKLLMSYKENLDKQIDIPIIDKKLYMMLDKSVKKQLNK
jgi:hypothetical protein